MNRPPNEPYNVHSYNQLTSHNSQLLPCEIAITISLADWRLLPWREIARMRNTHRESTSCTACVAAAGSSMLRFHKKKCSSQQCTERIHDAVRLPKLILQRNAFR